MMKPLQSPIKLSGPEAPAEMSRGEITVPPSGDIRVALPDLKDGRLELVIRQHYTNENERAALVARYALGFAALLFCCVVVLALVVFSPRAPETDERASTDWNLPWFSDE